MKKKLFSILILIAVCTASLSSCTEQEIKPADSNTGGQVSDPKGDKW